MSSAIIRQIKPEEVARLIELAAADKHSVLYPTHLITKDDGIHGYISVCNTPIVNVWLDSKKLVARDSIQLLNVLENVMRMTGRDNYIMPCSKDSPFYPNMARLCYSAIGETVLFHKNLNKE
jgi:hypothetical protein